MTDEGEIIDGETGKPDSRQRRIDLCTLRDIRKEMAYVYRALDRGELKSQEATRRVYILDAIGKVITVAEIERRIAELEDRQPSGAGAMPALSHHRGLN